MDFELWVKYILLFGTGGGKKIDDILVHFRLHELSKTTSLNYEFQNDKANILYSLLVENKFLEEALFLSKNFRIIPKYHFNMNTIKTDKELVKRIFISYLFIWSRKIFQKRDFTLACNVKRMLKQSINILSDNDKEMLGLINKKTHFNSWFYFMVKRKLFGTYKNG